MKEKEIKNPEALKAENQKRIESHKATAVHLETAAKHHQEAVKHYQAVEPKLLKITIKKIKDANPKDQASLRNLGCV